MCLFVYNGVWFVQLVTLLLCVLLGLWVLIASHIVGFFVCGSSSLIRTALIVVWVLSLFMATATWYAGINCFS